MGSEALARAYTLLVSAHPAVKRSVLQSPNQTALRLNRMLDDAIQSWVDAYIPGLAGDPKEARDTLVEAAVAWRQNWPRIISEIADDEESLLGAVDAYLAQVDRG